jgi:hypothetical protein
MQYFFVMHKIITMKISVIICATCMLQLVVQAQQPYPTAPPAPGNINAIEYFIDHNPGFGSGTALTGFASSQNITGFAGTVNLSIIAPGFHRIYFRSRDVNGNWSLANNSFFDNYNVPVYNPAPPAPVNITAVEYFFNNDPGLGNSTPLPITPGTNIADFATSVNIPALTPGVHRLFIRSRDASGKWSITNFSLFDNSSTIPYPGAPAALTNIVQVEYFIDNNDAGPGNCTPISITPGTNIANQNTNINITGLPSGVHRLFIRSKDANGRWSLRNLSIFDNSSVMPYPSAASAAPPISNMEYYIDTDPGFGAATPLTVPGNTGDISNYAVNINLSGSLSAGTHYLYIRSKQNPWSVTTVVSFSATGVVPLSWSFVKAQLRNKQVLVNWATLQEVNVKHFEIEHSTDGRQFTRIGSNLSKGNTTGTTHYEFIHNSPYNGFNYYRIKQVDKDGAFSYSAIVTVLNRAQLTTILLAPNPVQEVLNVVEPAAAFVQQVAVYNSAGVLMMRKSINADVQAYSIPVAALAAGNYVLRIQYRDESKSYNFLKD